MIKDDNGQTSILLLCGFILIVLGILIFVITIGSVVGMFTGITCIVFGVLLRILFYFREGRKRRKRIQEEIDASRAKRRKKEQEREEEIEKLCHYSNLQLLKAEDNLKKQARYIEI